MFLGKHFLIEFYGCKITRDVEVRMAAIMHEAAKRVGASVLGILDNLFAPHGCSVIVLVKESHLSIHTWPEFGYAAVDLFTCGSEMDPSAGLAYLKAELGADELVVQEVRRGDVERVSPNISRPLSS